MEDLKQNFLSFRTGDICLSSGENIGDLLIFIGRHSTIQHSCILVWLDVESLKENKIKVHPWYIDEQTTALSFLGLAEGSKLDMSTQTLQKGLILYEPTELFANAPIAYIRSLSREYISDEYITSKMEEYIKIYHLKMKYAYGKLHIVTVGLGFDVFGEHSKKGKLCSENIHIFLSYICDYPNFKIEGNDKLLFKDYKVPDAIERMYVPDFFSSEYNDHPVFESQEVRVISRKSEEDVTVWHPYFIAFVVIVIIIISLFLLINSFCESCRSGNGMCMINQKDFFDLL